MNKKDVAKKSMGYFLFGKKVAKKNFYSLQR